MKLAAKHQATEAILRDSGVPFALLRSSWYLENYTDELPDTLAQGAFAGSAGEGWISAASRVDYAEAAAAVLVETKPARSTNLAWTTPSRFRNWHKKSVLRPKAHN